MTADETMRAVTRPFDGRWGLDDLAGADGVVFARGDIGVAGRGVADRVPAAQASARLRGISHDDESDGRAGPIAIGAVPFHAHLGAELVVPAVVLTHADDGTRWLTLIDDAEEAFPLPVPGPPAATTFTVRPASSIQRYLQAVAAARDAVRAGTVEKAVIARAVEIVADGPIDVRQVLARLRSSYGSSYRYSFDGVVGASPELLVEVRGNDVRSHPLAGTTARTGDPAVDARLAAQLVASTKNQVEHRVVIEMVHDTLLPWCSYLDWEPEPSVVEIANVQHLGTSIAGRLSDPPPDVVELVTALAPTPALGGYPREAALALIAELEDFERGRYGGAVGWVNEHGAGTWAVTIRCAELTRDRHSARLVAGGGIVAESDPLAELAETQAKLQAMLSAIVRP